MNGLQSSPGHFANILDPFHRKVNIGIAYQHPTLWLVQLFVGDYIEYSSAPDVALGQLHISGSVKNGVDISGQKLAVTISWDQPPHALTRAQLYHTECLSGGTPIAGIEFEAAWGSHGTYQMYGTRCPDPYEVAHDAPTRMSYSDPNPFMTRTSFLEKLQPVITDSWQVDGDSFVVDADLRDLIRIHGEGVYTIQIWGQINSTQTLISEYPIFITSEKYESAIAPTATSTSTATLTPTAPATPAPTATVAPTSTTLASPTSAPTTTPVPTATETPSPTSTPSATPTSTPSPTATPTLTPTATPTSTPINAQRIDAREVEVLTHQLINEERIKHGSEPLEHVEQIRLIARLHSEDMATRDYFSHDTPEGRDPTDRGNLVGYQCRKAFGNSYRLGLGENIHQNWLFGGYQIVNGERTPIDWFTADELAAQAVKGWMDSPGHRENLLDATYDRAGMGVAIADSGKVFFAQNFC